MHNGLGDRVSQTVNGITTNFILDLNSGLTQVLQDGAYTYLYGTDRIAQYGAASTEYFLGDALGSVRQMTDASGAVILAKSYDPFGNVKASAGTGASRYGYTGESIESSGGVYLRARYYSPSTGRFSSRDTWEGDAYTPMSYNVWLYGYANRIVNTDPSGLKAIKPWPEYQAWLYQQGIPVDIGVWYPDNRLHLTEYSMGIIAQNFETDMVDTMDIMKYFKCEWSRKPNPIFYNRYDWLFSGWADYWSHRARLHGEVNVPGPNLIKAIAFAETRVGNAEHTGSQPTEEVVILVNNERNLLAGKGILCVGYDDQGKCIESELYGAALEKYLDGEKMTWGFVDLVQTSSHTEKYQDSDGVWRTTYSRNAEIGAAFRLFMAKFAKYKELSIEQNRPFSIAEVIQKYSDGSVPGYGANVWNLYQTGEYNGTQYFFVP